MGNKPKFYAVKVGKQPGIYQTWAECEGLVMGFNGAKYKSFPLRAEAEAWMAGETAASPVKAATASGSSDDKGKKRMMSPDVEDESSWDVVYSDGASKNNGKPNAVAGVGVWWGEGDPRNLAERCPGDQTNNRAELIAILRILETTPHSKRPLLIKSDSIYSINCFKSWIGNWIKRNWVSASGEPVKNAPLIRYISAQLDARARRGQKVRLQHVKGHSGQTGNEGADLMANKGCFEVSTPERHWAQLEAELRARLEVEFQGADFPTPSPLEVQADEDDIAVVNLGESPVKMRKISTEKPKSKTPVPSRPPAPSKPTSSVTPIPRAEAQASFSKVATSTATSTPQISADDLAQYAEGLLDDDDLLAELSD
ncbi:ribonuclease H-like domain-containing protein [Mycena metata]|uniref:Ribonuclease H n=1 Tax=Mycena metata TaxID=1033252 RepID=A0AAD7N8T6_9AGAR|nr:ribonuclease H-like domain-containing protein [Mycena metata]